MLFAGFCALTFAFWLWGIKRLLGVYCCNSRDARYPPGPRPKPFIGNILDFPTLKAYEVYAEWGKRFKSDILYASAPGTKVLVLNKLEDAVELLDRRARITSDRPAIPILDLIGWDKNVGLLRYGDSWRYHRKICQQNFRAESARSYRPLLLRKCRDLLQRLLEDPENFDEHNKMLLISVPMITMFGYEVDSLEDTRIVAAEESIRLAGPLLAPGGSWLNVLPALRYIPAWVPGAVTHQTGAKIRNLSNQLWNTPFEYVQRSIEEGTDVPSLVASFLKKKRAQGASIEEEEAVRNIAFTVYSAASDTTISATASFFYLMADHPDVQRKAQAEIDRIIGPGRLPDFGDRPFLPYIDAIYREVLRYRPPGPLGVAHALTEDDYYNGYFIPKGKDLFFKFVSAFTNASSGTVIFPNIWAMTRDETLYPDALKFKPERFLDESGKLDNDKRVLTYGFGRRICVGKYIASDTLWITFVSVLACFNIDKCRDEQGEVIDWNHDYEDWGLGQ